MISDKKIQEIIDKYQRIADQRMGCIKEFNANKRPFLVCVGSPSSMYNNCNSIPDSFESNMSDFDIALDYPGDTLPYIAPWFGVGAYADAFGCEYFWRDGQSPACHYKYHKIEEVAGICKPDIADGTIFKMILDAIAYFKERTKSKIPICLTDTQSPNDTATLVLDAAEVFTASYSEPEILHNFLSVITELIIEFSRVQAEAIGENLSRPGHIMSPSITGGRGISISDDNLAVCSPHVNEQFLLPYGDRIGEAFGGLAIHSCGNFGHSMGLIAKMKSIMMVDFALGETVDPNPNIPQDPRDAFNGTGIIVQARVSSDMERACQQVKDLWAPEMRMVIKLSGRQDEVQQRYETMTKCLEKLYG